MSNIQPRPIISEKGFALAESGTYLFEIPLSANKIEIKSAVENAFKVKVVDVRTAVLKGKEVRRRTRKTNVGGKTSDKKRAFVTLAKGEKISIFEDK
jgi:large subunit ribosomal protein L23